MASNQIRIVIDPNEPLFSINDMRRIVNSFAEAVSEAMCEKRDTRGKRLCASCGKDYAIQESDKCRRCLMDIGLLERLLGIRKDQNHKKEKE